jgi:hypothetical protein
LPNAVGHLDDQELDRLLSAVIAEQKRRARNSPLRCPASVASKRSPPVDIEQKVLERLATSDKTTIVIEKQPDRKMRVTSGSWDDEKVFLKDQGLEVRNVDGRLHVARKTKRYDDWDPPMSRYGPGALGDQAIDD